MSKLTFSCNKMSININLSIGYQNIEGLHNSLMGCKLQDQIELINDIEILSETWSECNKCKNVTVENYEILKTIDPIKKGNIKKGRKSGGIQVYCKSAIKPHLKVIKTCNSYIWFEINKSIFHDINKNVLICAIYSQPVSSTYYSEEIWENLEYDIINLTTNETPFSIIGDMNGRVGEKIEFTQNLHKDINSSIMTRSVTETPRRNIDKEKPCKIGEKIINLCKSYDMQIGNGRMKGDFLGNFTHHNKNTGQSTVDLALISDSLYPFIDDFKVLPQPVFSDHCKIVLTINNIKHIKTTQPSYKWLKQKQEYKWDKNNSPEKFRSALGTTEIACLIDECNKQIGKGSVETAGMQLQNIFQKAAEFSLEKNDAKKTFVKKRPKKSLKKWFDNDCNKLKTLANKASNLKHRHPWDKKLQESHRKILKEFKHTCRTKKTQFWKSQIEYLNNITKDDNFWEKWKKLGEDLNTSNQFPDNEDGQKWENHFKNLFTKENGDIDKLMKKVVTPTNLELNSKFKIDELKHTIAKLKNKKAVGPDSIANEFLKLAPENLLKLILDYINLNLEKGITCSKWCFDTISLIHKEGPKDDPNNYRGICIMNTLLKILCTLLNNRLIAHCSKHNLINKEQIGFQQNNRTSDHILTLKSIVNKYVTDQKGKKLYTCFIDFQKAFDSIWHEGLFRKLENKNINGSFLNLIKNIYSQTQCAVKINKNTTNFFNYEKGVQQGNPLSPLLFNLFINDIFDIIKNDNSLLTLDNKYNFNALMYADDLIIMSPTQEGLQKSINALSEYCKKWKLNINTKKTKCMIFSKGTNIKNTKFLLHGRNIMNTKEYKYLGITINSKNCTFTPTLNDLSCKANKAIYSLFAKLPIKMMPIKTMLKIFDACITPILLK